MSSIVCRQLQRRLRRVTQAHAEATAQLNALRLQLQQQSAASATQTATLLQTMSTAIIAENHLQQVVLVNQRLCDLLGLPESPTTYMGCTHAEILEAIAPRITDPAYVQRMEQAVRSQARISGQLLPLTNGRIVQQEYLPIMQNGLTVLHLWSFEDVTEREQAQEQIQQFSLITQQSPNPFIRVTRDGQAQSANAAAEQVLVALAKPTEQDTQQFLRREVARALEQNEIHTTERRLDGCFYVWKIVPLPAEDAAIIYLTDITDRRRAEAELLHSQLFVARINDTVPSLLFLYDLDKRLLTYSNRQSEVLLGYTEAELKGMGSEILERLILTTDLEAMRAEWAAAALVQPGQPFIYEFRVRHRNGAWRWFRVQLTPFTRQPDGTAIQLIGSAQDITNAREIEEELRHSRLLMERVASTAPNLIYIYDVQRNVSVYVNRYAVTALGYTQAELQEMGSSIGERLFAYGERQRMIEHYHHMQAAADGEVHTLELYVYHRNGSIRWLRCNNTPFERDEQGRVRLLLGTAEDITQWKIADEQRRLANGRLAEQNRLFRQVIDTAPPLIYLKDDGGNYLLANQATAQLYGLTPSTIVRTPFEQLSAASEDLARYRAHDQEVLRLEKRIAHEETFTRPDGEVMWFHSIKQPFVLTDGTMQVLGVSSNITDLKRTQQELRQAKEAAEANARAKQEFLANMSHEIRTPMNGILGIANLLAKTPLDEQQSEYLGHIQHSAESLLVVINDVLDMAQLDAGKITPEITTFDLRDVLRASQQTIQPKAHEKGVALELELPPSRIATIVLGDPYRLRQILLNLLSNAVKFTSQGRVLLSCRRLSATQESTVFRFSVQDTGIGISAHQLEQMFEPFTQASSSTAREYGGSGLGLSISQRLAELLGGHIAAQSEVGEGSTFYFDLPFQYAELPSQPVVNEPPPRYHTLSKRRVLLAEDNMVNQFLVETILRNWGMVVDTASSGPDALRLFQEHHYDVVLMDIQMPGMDGVQATQQLRQHPDPARASTPVVALTAHALPSEAAYYRQAGLDAHLSKPFREEDLFHTIWELLNQRPAPTSSAATATPSTSLPTPPDASMSSAKPTALYDLSGIRRLAHGNEGFVKRLVQLFIRTTPPCVRELEEHLTSRNWDSLASTAHHLKSSLDGMHIRTLHGTIRQLETDSKTTQDAATLSELVKQVRQVTEAVIDQLQQEFPEE